jgi:hypothetical protein
MSSRLYNKLYVHADREEGSEKLLLGYQNDVREIVLAKDTETLFHVPFYSSSVKLADSTLIRDGATAGPFPAAADRIFKNHKNYGNVTSNGNTTDLADGVWFCSWLHRDEYGYVQWMDRYYNSGSLVMSVAIAQMTEGPVYKKNNPVYRDVPSQMVLEAGVHYRYFHVGEKTAKHLVSTFAGVSGERLALNLENWGYPIVDTSVNTLAAKIVSNDPTSNIYHTTSESDRLSAAVINFDNTYNTEVSLDYSNLYNFTNEFTMSFWAHSNDWNSSQSTQLVGNFSSNGGVGLFVDTLSSYPFFVIPETGYGHMLFVNEGFGPFLDKSLQITTSLTATPQFVALDADNNLFVCYSDNSHRIAKFDVAGKLLAVTTLVDPSQTIRQTICGPDDTLVVITDTTRYTYDTNLSLIGTQLWETLPTAIAAYAAHDDGTAELISTNEVHDSKFLYTDHWCLTSTTAPDTNGNLLVKYTGDSDYTIFAKLSGTTLGIDPFDRIWVLHDGNKLSVYDSNADPLIAPIIQTEIGQDVPHIQKNISFMCVYDRGTNTRKWRCVVYYADGPDAQVTPQLYILDMSASLVQTIDILSLFNRNVLSVLNQQQQNFQFMGRGDFTGYERRRVFNNLPPFNGSPALILRASLKDKTKDVLSYVPFKTHVSMSNWDAKSWQHVALILQNRTFKVYVNKSHAASLSYSGQYDLSYDLQPSFFVGTSVGSQAGFNQEVGHVSCIFNGMFEDIKIYDYAMDTKNLDMFQRASIPAQNIYWSLPTPMIQYIEKVERMFKNKIPGAKSNYFRIKLSGTFTKDPQTRIIIEQHVRELVSKIQPMHTNFLGIHWVEN